MQGYQVTHNSIILGVIIGIIGSMVGLIFRDWLTTPYPKFKEITRVSFGENHSLYGLRIEIRNRFGTKMAKNARCRVAINKGAERIHDAHTYWADVTEEIIGRGSLHFNLSSMDVVGYADLLLFEIVNGKFRVFCASLPRGIRAPVDKMGGKYELHVNDIRDGKPHDFTLRISFASENARAKREAFSLKGIIEKLPPEEKGSKAINSSQVKLKY
jgi:hypothetical protein